MCAEKHMFRAISLLLLVSLISIMFTGCNHNKIQNNAYRTVDGFIPETQLLASNSDYELHWDANGKAVLFKSKKNDEYWSDILYDAFINGNESANGNSPISITVADSKTLKWDTVTSYEAMAENENIVCKKIENGIRVTYFFNTYRIAVPVDYTLRKDSLNVSIDGSKILEDGEDFKLVSVSLTPLFCSVSTSEKEGYLFIPSGSGALMSSKIRAEGTRKFQGEIYGEDGARQIPSKEVDYEEIRLPVFGSAGGGKALLGIIEEGAGAAVIEAQAGNEKLENSNVGAVFYFRGYDKFIYERYGKPMGITQRITDNIAKQKMSVSYYPLFGKDANYNGMAGKYREYLLKKKLLIKSEAEKKSYGVTFLGGTVVTKSILGIPKTKTVALTTFSDAKDILSTLKEETGVFPCVRMLGYGDMGINSGTVAGGKNYLNIYGNKKDLSDLIRNNKDTEIYIDSDIVTYAKSGAGYSLSRNVAKTAIKYKAEHFIFTPTRVVDKHNPYYIISRKNLPETIKIVLEKAEKYGNQGISLSSIGSIAYSDYNSEKYANKNGMQNDVSKIIKKVKDSGYSVAVADGNDYAACCADVVFDVATQSAQMSVFDVEVPFYQLVFHSYKPLYSKPLNLDENDECALSRAAAYGMGIGYTFTNSYQDESNDLDKYGLYGTNYDDNAKMVKEALIDKDFNKIYAATADAEFVSYTFLENGVSVSKFGNGVTVYANLSNKKVQTPIGELQPYAFITN